MDIYGDHNSILLDENQISMNTESFSLKNQPSLDFSNLQSFKFDPNKRVRVHLERLNTQHVSEMDITTAFDFFRLDPFQNAASDEPSSYDHLWCQSGIFL